MIPIFLVYIYIYISDLFEENQLLYNDEYKLTDNLSISVEGLLIHNYKSEKQDLENHSKVLICINRYVNLFDA